MSLQAEKLFDDRLFTDWRIEIPELLGHRIVSDNKAKLNKQKNTLGYFN